MTQTTSSGTTLHCLETQAALTQIRLTLRQKATSVNHETPTPTTDSQTTLRDTEAHSEAKKPNQNNNTSLTLESQTSSLLEH